MTRASRMGLRGIQSGIVIALIALSSLATHAQEDFGDAPMPYPTTQLDNGARHTIVPGVTMGLTVDDELDGQPDADAQGDDNTNLADEDGVVFLTPFIPGDVAVLDVTVSVAGWVDAWFDFDQDGVWAGVERVTTFVAAGVNAINVLVPAGAAPGVTFARFRYNTNVPLTVDGPAANGEVEDHEIVITGLDYGDAPDPPYQTFFFNNGARHTVAVGVSMGALIDAEVEGQAVFDAQGDDGLGVDDEDGVLFLAPLIQGGFPQVEVTVTAAGWLDAWIDFDQNGIWDVAEQVIAGPVVPGANVIGYVVPAAAFQGPTFARFRYNIDAVQLLPEGLGPDGEVEDYEVLIQDPNDQWDYGDAGAPTRHSSPTTVLGI